MLILIVLLILSGVFSGSETALVTLSMARAEGLVKEGRRGAKALLELKRDPSRMLITILIGNNVVNIAASALATVIATERLGKMGPGVAVGVLTMLILVFGEITPKSLATRYSERISLFIAPLMLLFMRLIYPLVWLFGQLTTWLGKSVGAEQDPTVTETELVSLVEHGEREGTIESHERQFIERVFDFTDLRVEDVMTPRRQVFALDGRSKIKEISSKVLGKPHTRIPLHGKDPNEIFYVLHLRDFINAVIGGNTEIKVREIAHDPLFCPPNQPIEELFRTLRRHNMHMAVVVDDHGLMVGVVTLEDLMEELVGEIYDESDKPPTEFTELSKNKISIDGATELRVLEQYFDIVLPDKSTDTVSRWILNHSERIPDAKEKFSLDGLDVTIKNASQRRIHQVIVSKA